MFGNRYERVFQRQGKMYQDEAVLVQKANLLFRWRIGPCRTTRVWVLRVSYREERQWLDDRGYQEIGTQRVPREAVRIAQQFLDEVRPRIRFQREVMFREICCRDPELFQRAMEKLRHQRIRAVGHLLKSIRTVQEQVVQ